jgi:hypothetical protein
MRAKLWRGNPYGQKIKTAAKMTVVQASTMEQLSAPEAVGDAAKAIMRS